MTLKKLFQRKVSGTQSLGPNSNATPIRRSLDPNVFVNPTGANIVTTTTTSTEISGFGGLLTTISGSGTMNGGSSPRSDAQLKTGINKLPYDVLSAILANVHQNQVVTKSFVDISLVCRHWRTLSRINGSTFDLNSFFIRNESLKMKSDLVEKSLSYISYLYPSVDRLIFGSYATEPTNIKHAMYYIDKMERVTSIEMDLNRCHAHEFGQLCTAIRDKRGIKTVSFYNASSEYVYHMVDFLDHTRSITDLTITNACFDNRQDGLIFHDYLLENTTLQSISLTFTGTYMIESFKEAIASNPSITNLHLRLKQNSDGAFHTFSKFSYPHARHVMQRLSLPHCNLSSKDFDELATVLSNNSSIVSLDLSDNPLVESVAVKNLVNALAGNQSLQLHSLNLSGLQIDDFTLKSSICKLINSKPSLKVLDLSNCPRRWDEGFVEFVSSIERSSIVKLSLSKSNITNKSFSNLVEMVKNNRSMVSNLNLSGTLNQSTGNALGGALGSNTTITELDISNCELHQAGAGTIGISLMSNKTLHTLNMSNTYLHNYIALLIADSMKKNTTLTSLDLGYNAFSSESLGELFQALQQNNTLISLNLENTGIGKKDCGNLSTLLEINNQLSLNISSNNISNANFNQLMMKLSTHNYAITNVSPIKIAQQSPSRGSHSDSPSNSPTNTTTFLQINNETPDYNNNNNNNNRTSPSISPSSSFNMNIINIRNIKFNDTVYHQNSTLMIPSNATSSTCHV